MSDIKFTGVDYGTMPAIIITDTYTRDGKHVLTAARTEDGKVLWEEGPCPSKNCTFLFSDPRTPEPETEKNDFLRLLDTLAPLKPRLGFGPFREDYATQEAFDHARGVRVAIEDKL